MSYGGIANKKHNIFLFLDIKLKVQTFLKKFSSLVFYSIIMFLRNIMELQGKKIYNFKKIIYHVMFQVIPSPDQFSACFLKHSVPFSSFRQV